MGHRRRRGGMDAHFTPRLGGVLVLVALVAVVVAAGVIVPWLTKETQYLPEEHGQPSPQSTAQAAHAQQPTQLPIATAPQVHLPEVTLPSLPQAPQLAFTAEEVERLNQLLAAWAEEETFIVIEPEADGPSSAAGTGAGEDAMASNTEGEPGTDTSMPPPQNTPGAENAAPQTIADGGKDVSLWFLDVDSGAAYSYNAAFDFSYASLLKAPYAAWLYTLAADGACNLEEAIAVKPEDIGKYAENTGVLKEMELPAEFAVETLIGYMLESSDTVALRLLLARYPAEGFRQWAGTQGIAQPERLNSVLSGKLTADEAGILLQAVYRVIQQNPHGPQLRAHMERAGNRMITSGWPVARKYGWDEHAYHDMGVVYAPHPYLLVIMTDKWGGSYAETAMFGTLTAELEGMMASHWQAYEAGL